MDTPTRPCRICRRPTRGQYCARCFAELYPEAAERSADTRHYRSLMQDADAYDTARAKYESTTPPKDRRADERDVELTGPQASDAISQAFKSLRERVK